MQGRLVDGQMRAEGLKTLAFRTRIDGVPVVLLRPDWGAGNLFRGSRIYGGSYNELEAYLYFSRCCAHSVHAKSNASTWVFEQHISDHAHGMRASILF